MDTRITIGKIIAPHGVRGEVKVLPLTDFPDRFQTMKSVWLDIKGKEMGVESVRFNNETPLVKFSGIDDRDQAEKLRNGLLQVLPEELVVLPAGHYYQFQIIGLAVSNEVGLSLGTVSEIIQTGANDIYVVKNQQGKELLIPALKETVLAIDIPAGRMVVKLLPGLGD